MRVSFDAMVRQKPVNVCPVFRGGHSFQPAAGLTIAPQAATLRPALGRTMSVLSKVSPSLLKLGGNDVSVFTQVSRQSAINVGVLLSGGPAPGGHNVIAGICDYIRAHTFPGSGIIGFLNGPQGVLDGRFIELTPEIINRVRNTGGFDLLDTSRTKWEVTDKKNDFRTCQHKLEHLSLNGLVVIGGDDSNTNAADLANFLLDQNSLIRIVGVPKTIDNDLQCPQAVPVSFGFDTAARHFASSVASICFDAASAKKIWHFVKLMGRSASHLTLEVALQTHPNIALIGEEIARDKKNLDDVVEDICRVVRARYDSGKKYGVVLIPEGIVDFIPEVKKLISAINHEINAIGNENFMTMPLDTRNTEILSRIKDDNKILFESFPREVQESLLKGLDPHGNVQVSKIASEILLMERVTRKLAAEKKGILTQDHSFGYDGRDIDPTDFDASLTYNLGLTAAALVMNGYTGCMAGVANLHRPYGEWVPMAVPLVGMMNIEMRKGKESLVIGKTLVNMDDPAYRYYTEHREAWGLGDHFRRPGTIQHDSGLNVLLELAEGGLKIVEGGPQTLEMQRLLEFFRIKAALAVNQRPLTLVLNNGGNIEE